MLIVGGQAFFKPKKDIVTVKSIYYGPTEVHCVEIVDASGVNFYCWEYDLIPMPELEPVSYTAHTLECSHDWRWYDSGWSRFEYCFKCNCERSTGEKR